MAGVAVLLVTMVFAAAVPGIAQGPPEPVIDCGARAQHDRIHISEDHGPNGFTWTNPFTGENEHRPESGVVAGDGSAGDPFVISGWCIEVSLGVLGPGMYIEDTVSHVVVRDNAVIASGELFQEAAVRIESVENIVLEQNLFARAEYGIGAWNSDGIVIRENTVLENHGFGFWVAMAEDAVIEDNRVMDNNNAISFGFAHGLRVEGNWVLDNRVGITNAFSDEVWIVDNQIDGNVDGIFIREAFDVVVEGNQVADNEGGGIAFDQSPRGVARDNQVTGSGNEGIMFWASPNSVATGNTATGNGFTTDRYGIRFAGSSGSVASGNIVTGNFEGFALDGSPDSLVDENIITDNEDAGVVLWSSARTRVDQNLLAGNEVGVRVHQDAQGVALQGNNIEGNHGGLGVDAVQADDGVLATGNWWGCPEGPGGALCDGVSGTVDVSDWLSAPNPAAPQAPQWVALEDQTVQEGEHLSFAVEATHAGGEALVLDALGLAPGAEFEQTLDEPGRAVGNFSWTPMFGQAGTHTVTFLATGGGIQSIQQVVITVLAGKPPEASLELGVVTPEPAGLAPGHNVTLVASVRNLGDEAVTVPLNVSSSAGWNVTTQPMLHLEQGETVHVPVEVEVGEESLSSRITLKAEVEGTPEIDRQVTWVLEVPVSVQVAMNETTMGSEITGEVFVHYADGHPVVGVPVQGVRSNGWDTTGALQHAFGGATNESGRLGFSFSPTDPAAQLPGTHTVTASAQVLGVEARGFVVYQVGLPV